MNSILQCILAATALRKYFLTEYLTLKHHRASPISSQFRLLLEEVIKAIGGPVNPRNLKNEVSRTVNQFSGYGQQDAQEFMRFLIDRMHDELNRVPVKQKYEEVQFVKFSVEEQSDKWTEYYHKRDDSIMTDLFQGQLINRLWCLSCGHQTYAFDNFMDLSIEIP